MGKQQIKQALQLVGNAHKYQKILVLLIFVSFILLDFVLLGSTLIFTDPTFKCLSTSDRVIYQSEACLMIQQCFVIDSFTLTAQLKLYCDLQWARDLIQSIFPFGSAFGLIIMNLLSDIKGRKVSTMICLHITEIGVFLNLLGGYYNNISIIIIGQFIAGFGVFPLISLAYALLSDFCGDSFKPRAVIIVNMAWSLAAILLGVLYLCKIHWMTFLSMSIIFPLILIILMMEMFLLEPPFILINQNKKYQALQIMLKIARINGNYELHHKKIREIIENQQFRVQEEKASFRNIFKIILKKQNYLKTVLILSLLRAISSLNFYGFSYAFAVQGLGLGYNSIFAGIIEIGSFIFLTLLIHKIPRKKGISGFSIIVFVLGFLYFFSSITENKISGTIIMCISRFFSTISSTLINSMETQAFTAQIQSTAVGFIQCFGLFGGMMGPLSVDISDKIGINPIAFLSFVVNFSIWIPIFLKQTLKVKKQPKQQQEALLQNQIDSQNRNQSMISQN